MYKYVRIHTESSETSMYQLVRKWFATVVLMHQVHKYITPLISILDYQEQTSAVFLLQKKVDVHVQTAFWSVKAHIKISKIISIQKYSAK